MSLSSFSLIFTLWFTVTAKSSSQQVRLFWGVKYYLTLSFNGGWVISVYLKIPENIVSHFAFWIQVHQFAVHQLQCVSWSPSCSIAF